MVSAGGGLLGPLLYFSLLRSMLLDVCVYSCRFTPYAYIPVGSRRMLSWGNMAEARDVQGMCSQPSPLTAAFLTELHLPTDRPHSRWRPTRLSQSAEVRGRLQTIVRLYCPLDCRSRGGSTEHPAGKQEARKVDRQATGGWAGISRRKIDVQWSSASRLSERGTTTIRRFALAHDRRWI